MTTTDPTLADLVAVRLAGARASHQRATARLVEQLGREATDVRGLATVLEDVAAAEGEISILATVEYFVGHPTADLRAYLTEQLLRSPDDRWSGLGTRNALGRAHHEGTLTALRWAMAVTK